MSVRWNAWLFGMGFQHCSLFPRSFFPRRSAGMQIENMTPLSFFCVEENVSKFYEEYNFPPQLQSIWGFGRRWPTSKSSGLCSHFFFFFELVKGVVTNCLGAFQSATT
ncbi:uncharacterized protein TM35_000391290 [Trypanosoma theileri]|uniref:Uncharacterized protein n=1 Tax=Trypanosoma theileri TaxID=67003 RepID=A0A1X0NJM7_9TRYP|nr:uncharacterized protein TM35_000391290 [Trypanosoma theileri]ORC84955.1 hypothetical protein TM35_000391290 [Trypanosoma theileri]